MMKINLSNYSNIVVKDSPYDHAILEIISLLRRTWSDKRVLDSNMGILLSVRGSLVTNLCEVILNKLFTREREKNPRTHRSCVVSE